MDKAGLRIQYQSVRRAIPRSDVVSRSTVIAQHVQQLVNWHNTRRVHIYRTNRKTNEVETAWFEAYLATIWPQVELTIGVIDKNADIPTGHYDVIIVPLLAFDSDRHRLGFGGGWYDRFLRMNPLATTVGLALDDQFYAPGLPSEPHDMRLDYVVTESRTFGPSGTQDY